MSSTLTAYCWVCEKNTEHDSANSTTSNVSYFHCVVCGTLNEALTVER